MARPRDTAVDEAIVAATLDLLAERGFGATTVEAVAEQAGVGKPAIYRRHPDKAALVAAAIRTQLPSLEVPELGDTRAELETAMERGFPADATSYLRLLGGLAAEEGRHPELIAAFRETILLPRRRLVRGLIARGIERGEVRTDVDPEAAMDALAGALLARAFAGVDTGPGWRRANFQHWWRSIAERKRR